jgi:hypothetical protein
MNCNGDAVLEPDLRARDIGDLLAQHRRGNDPPRRLRHRRRPREIGQAVAAAVGEGAQVVAAVHTYLASAARLACNPTPTQAAE